MCMHLIYSWSALKVSSSIRLREVVTSMPSERLESSIVHSSEVHRNEHPIHPSPPPHLVRKKHLCALLYIQL
jgi:hypothetical protein